MATRARRARVCRWHPPHRPTQYARAVGLIAVAVIAVIATVPSAQAATTCSISTTGIAFGGYDPTKSAAVSANGTVSVGCTYTGTGFTVAVSLATGNSGAYASRSMLSGSNALAYNIYLNTADTYIFGNGTGGSYYFTGCYAGGTYTCPTGGGVSGSTETGSVYGVLPAGQDIPAGSYSDSMVLTITY